MKTRKLTVALVFCFLGGSAFAGLAQLRPPAGISGSAATGWKYKPPANEATWQGNTVRTTASLNVGGQEVTMPVAMRMAANAAPVIAGALSLNPWILAGTAGAALLAQYWLDRGLTPSGNPTDAGWMETRSGTEWSINGGVTWFGSADAACKSLGNGDFYYDYRVGYMYCRNGHVFGEGFNYGTPGSRQASGTGPVTQQHVADLAREAINMPPVPQFWPDPLPIESPVINPVPRTTPYPDPYPPTADPAEVPSPLPYVVPLGSPQLMPKINPNDANEPARWKTPVVEIRPFPTADNPWQVDVTPKDVIRTDPNPPTSTQTVPDTNNPTTAPPAQEATERTPGLCEQFPDILACQKLGSVVPDNLPKANKAITVVADTFATSTGCPSPLSFSVMGHSHAFTYQPLCDALGMLKFLFAAIAAFIAAYILADSFRVT